jgi:hypothetical protein
MPCQTSSRAKPSFPSIVESSQIYKQNKSRLVTQGGFYGSGTSFLLFVFDLNNRFTSVRPALGANVVRQVVFSTTFTHNQVLRREGIVRTPFVPACFGNFAFRQRAHSLFSSEMVICRFRPDSFLEC